MINGGIDMDKMYKVFVSSTYEDLKDERREVEQALLEMDCMPVGMELFPASDEDTWTFIKGVIESCDYYVLIIGGRYGSCGPDGVSYTEKEYDYAVSVGIPVISFLHEDPTRLLSGNTEMTDAGRKNLERFQNKVKSERTCRFWTGAGDLGAKVSRSCIQLMKMKPREGWVRGGLAVSPEMIGELDGLRRRNAELESRLAEIVASADESKFAQGSDTHQLKYHFPIEYGTDPKQRPKYGTDSVNITWDEIFGYVARSMLEPMSFSTFRGLLERLVGSRLTNEQRQAVAPHPDKHDARQSTKVGDEIALTVLMQFRALGLVSRTEPPTRPHPPSLGFSRGQRESYWRLTDRGELKYAESLAIKRPA